MRCVGALSFYARCSSGCVADSPSRFEHELFITFLDVLWDMGRFLSDGCNLDLPFRRTQTIIEKCTQGSFVLTVGCIQDKKLMMMMMTQQQGRTADPRNGSRNAHSTTTSLQIKARINLKLEQPLLQVHPSGYCLSCWRHDRAWSTNYQRALHRIIMIHNSTRGPITVTQLRHTSFAGGSMGVGPLVSCPMKFKITRPLGNDCGRGLNWMISPSRRTTCAHVQ